MKFSIEYYDFNLDSWMTEVCEYSARSWADYWDATRRGEIEIIDCQMSYDDGETWESVF